MNMGSSAGKKILAGKVFAVGVVMLFVLSGVIAILGEKPGGVGRMEEQEIDDKLGYVMNIGREGGDGSHGEWKGERDGGDKGGIFCGWTDHFRMWGELVWLKREI